MSCGAEGPVLIIGFGNQLRGDDGAGPAAAERLEALLPADRVVVWSCHQLVPEMAEPVAGAAAVVFIDAAADSPPGEIRMREAAPVVDSSIITQTHGFDPGHLLGCAQYLFGRAPRAVLFSVGGEDFSIREGFSPTVAQAMDELVARVRQFVEGLLSAPGARA